MQKLALIKETLQQITDQDAHQVAGAMAVQTSCGRDCSQVWGGCHTELQVEI